MPADLIAHGLAAQRRLGVRFGRVEGLGAIKELCGDMSVLQFYMLKELAKELNGAGFPNIQDLQHRQGREFLNPEGRISIYSVGDGAPTEDWFLPTLYELIAACGDKFSTLILDGGKWRCTASGYEGYDDLYSTPTEAVARLWMALNKKA
jgi:hypothetical protein